MGLPFDLAPTARLSGVHMIGNVVRRFLISYPVCPDVLADHLPPGAECATHDGFAWVSACFVQMDDDLDAIDIDLLSLEVRTGGGDLKFDLTRYSVKIATDPPICANTSFNAAASGA